MPNSTSHRSTSNNDEDFPAHAEKTHDCYVAVHSLDEPTGQVYVDQMGEFPCTSSNGNHYVMVLYDYDSNAILMDQFEIEKAPPLSKHTNGCTDD